MKKLGNNSFSNKNLLLILFSLCLISIKSATVYEINEEVPYYDEYKKAEFSSDSKTLNHYFKYSVTRVPTSRISAFRFEFDQFSTQSLRNVVLCTFVDESTTDDQLIEEVRLIDNTTSSCIGEFDDNGIFDGIIEYDQNKRKLAIWLVTHGQINFTARIYLRTTEKILSVNEQTVLEDESYSLVPYTITISHFREFASKILFYSYTRELQMYYVEEDSPHPERLFFGNILSVYTNPNMVRQKYHNADTMVLLTKPFGQPEMIGEAYKFQVKFFASDYLLDYYMGSDLTGRSKNTPLAINMTMCQNPYYVVLNYNQPEKQTSLYIDEIYGRIKSLSVAPTLSRISWEEMIEKDMQEIDINLKKFILPKNSPTHIDVYKVECEIPLLLNFYFIDESAKIPDLNYGQVAITNLKAYKSVYLPFASGIILPELTIEIFNPIKEPLVIVDDGQNENVISKNSLIKSMPFNTNNPLVVKERNGDTDTRVIIKVGYSTGSWRVISENIVYSPTLNMYVFSFPNDANKLNYTYANLVTSGTNEEDNIKYCYGTNIGSAILPSKENCYRVSKENSYTIKIINPRVMHKEYELNDDLNYYVSLKPTNSNDEIDIKVELNTYDTTERNFEGVGNKLELTNGQKSTILTAPENKEELILLQISSCDNSKISYGIFNGFNPTEQIVPDTEIPENSKLYYHIYKNIFLENEVKITGNNNAKVFVKHGGIIDVYTPDIKESYPLSFDQELNQLIVESPLENTEKMKYTILVGKKGDLSNQDISLCSFVELTKPLSNYNRTIISYQNRLSVSINFNKVGLKAGETFEAIVLIEQQLNSRMAFLTDLYTDVVGEIKTESITEIKNIYDIDNDYVFSYQTATTDKLSYYFSYQPTEIFEVPVGAFSIEFDTSSTGAFSDVYCAFVDEGEDAQTMVEAIEDIEIDENSYCIGGRSTTNEKIYNFMFKYSYTKDNKPRKLVIKILNEDSASGGFTVYIRKGSNTYIKQTDFDAQEEYGRQEEYKKSIMPYIVDLEKIRGNDTQTDYVSKLLIYSQHLEMQMYYIDETGEKNAPLLLFTGNIMLVYTKYNLAVQKYHSSKLILLSENLNGQEHSSLGNTFRFHTKMYKSTDQLEYFVSNNPNGRTLNYPLSAEMNICTSSNNKYYYILNYNKPEDKRILYLDLVFGSLKKARIVNEINAEKWDSLISMSMTDINDYQVILQEKSQHIDVVEFECNTPLMANIYYSYENQAFNELKRGDIAVKNLASRESATITLDPSVAGTFYYSVSLFNPKENPDITVNFDSTKAHQINENSLQIGLLFKTPENIYIVNNGNSATRFIFKIGYRVESEWVKEKENIEGELYSDGGNKFVYKFPLGDNKKNFTDVVIKVKPTKKDSEEESANVKFCYSASIGTPIGTSKENCFRTGATIPYSLTFINPIIAPKNYKSYSDYYYVTLSPFYDSDYISLDITENKYKTNERNIEGVNNIITLENTSQKSTILSIPEVITNTKVFVQLEVCKANQRIINYTNKNAYTGDVISTGTASLSDKFYYYFINNNLMETELELSGAPGDIIFVKHTGITDYSIILQTYSASFDSSENVVTIVKPIKDESFRVTVLVGPKGFADNYNLCTFAEKSEKQYSELAKYAKTFTSVSSNNIVHYIDFRSFSYNEGDEFDLLVYAVQMENSKIEILYDVISGVVGKIQGVTQISGIIDSYHVTQEFIQNKTSNYLFYDFTRTPLGNVASLKIINSEGLKVNKVGCFFVAKNTEDSVMVSKVNEAMVNGTSVCIGETQKDDAGFDALINAIDVQGGYPRLVIQVIYGLGDDQNDKVSNGEYSDDESTKLTINLRVTGFEVTEQDVPYNENEQLSMVPYVLNLEKIRGDQAIDYVSKVMVYSSKREMQMFYMDRAGAPVELFSGNIMLVYTNTEVIKEKYKGASTMILITDSLSSTQSPIMGETFRFKAYFFKSDNTIQYYVSANPDGRLLNNPTSIEMLSCEVPYYYILNYHFPEGDRNLHIDKIFGEINTIKFADKLNNKDWYEMVKNMNEFKGNEYLIKGQTNYHIDIIEVTCKIPTLLNIYYTDNENPKIQNLDQGDISIIDLNPGESQKLLFKMGLKGEFIYNFNVNSENNKPNIGINFEDEDSLNIDKNGVFSMHSSKNYEYIIIKNNELTGSEQTKVIFKFGYDIESIFTKIENDVYNLQTEDRLANLFAYKFKTGEDRLNYTQINFTVTTTEENVKFCYITNLGAFIDPSLQNCYRVGRANHYTISVLNPYIMYKDYYTGDGVMDYYVSFRTENIEQNITIKPELEKYSTNNRNIENFGKSISITDKGSTILTSPENNNKYLFVQIHVCTPDKAIIYQFNNAYNSSSLHQDGEIQANTKNNFRNIENIKMDTELLITTQNSAKIFVKHVGVDEIYRPVVKDIEVSFDGESKSLYFTQPIKNEEFKYTIYLDKKGNLRNQAFTLCSFAEISKLAHYTKSIISNKEKESIPLDFNENALKGYESFDVLVLAEGVNNGKIIVLSNIYSHSIIYEDESSNLVLIIVLIILALLLVVGGIVVVIFLKKYKKKSHIQAKTTSLAMVSNKTENMVSMTESVANPDNK